jgi:glutamate 5-kinase
MSALSAPSSAGRARAASVEHLAAARRIVIKVGTNVILRRDGLLALGPLYGLIESIATLRRAGRDVLLVSSGAVGLGAEHLGAGDAGQAPDAKCAHAAIGQSRLMALYEHGFAQLGRATAQMLVAEDDVASSSRRRQLRATINTLFRAGIVPVLNENDAVAAVDAADGARDASAAARARPRVFSDNDMLAAVVASTIDADALLLLTDVDGLYTANPTRRSDATLIPVLHAITAEVLAAADGHGPRGRGGMAGKLAAAQVALDSGIITVLANGRRVNAADLLSGGIVAGTIFLPRGFDSGHQA